MGDVSAAAAALGRVPHPSSASPPTRLASRITPWSPALQASTTFSHMMETMPATEALSAPPERGRKNPDAPERRR